jgi:hypothetical protein
MASPNISEIATSAIQNRTGALADNVSDNNALLFRLRQKGNKRPVDGGEDIRQELEYAENSTFMYYSGSDVLNISQSDVMTSANYSWKQAAVAVIINGLEEMQNSGKSRIIDLLKARIRNAERTMKNQIASGVYSDGTGSAGKQIGGLQLLVADTNTNTVGGINASTYSFWRNISFDASSDGGAAASATNIQSYMNRVYVQIVRGTDRPDLIVADNTYWRLYLESLQAIQRISDDKMAQAGFMNLKYMDADVVLDGAQGGGCPSDHMYFLNTEYIFYRPHTEKDMVPLNADRLAVNQDAMVKLIGWGGNMTVSNRSLQGVLKA